MRDQLLTRHFLQRFLDNDLLSPQADRHETLSLVGAALISSGLFVSCLLGFGFLAMPYPSPGRIAISALSDRCLYLSWSMMVMALVAVTAWDGLVLDARDTLILGPLPIAHRLIMRAKLKAVVLLAAGVTVALIGAPSILHPLAMVARLPIGLLGAAGLIVIHAAMTSAAGAFGFLSVLGAREVCRALLGPGGFNRVSSPLQLCLVVLLTTVLLLIPGWSRDVGRAWLASSARTTYAYPPLWFLGLQETLAGPIIDQLPRGALPGRVLASEQQATAVYRSYGKQLHDLGVVALVGLSGVLVVTVAACAWNSRRLPAPLWRRPTARSGLRVVSARIAQRWLIRRALAQAGFFFTLQSLWRSAPHRLAIATSAAVGVATLTMMLRGADLYVPRPVSSSPLGVFALQFVLLGVISAGFRYAVRIPAELRANWIFRLAWSGDERPYMDGVKRAALVQLGFPAVAVLFPLYVGVLGVRLALVHVVSGALIVALMLDVAMLGFRKLPFACSYHSDERLKGLASIYVVAFAFAAYALAWVERLAFSSTSGPAAYMAGLVALMVVARGVDIAQRRRRQVIDFDEGPTPATQRLSLSG